MYVIGPCKGFGRSLFLPLWVAIKNKLFNVKVITCLTLILCRLKTQKAQAKDSALFARKASVNDK